MTCRIGSMAEGSAPDHSLHARRQRHAFRQCPGLRHAKTSSPISRMYSTCSTPRASGRQDDVGRFALPACGRPDAPRVWRDFSTTLARASAFGRAPARHRPTLHREHRALAAGAPPSPSSRSEHHEHGVARKPQRNRQDGFHRRARRHLRARAVVAQAVYGERPFGTLAALHDAMMSAVRAAPTDQRLALIKGIPISRAKQRAPA